MESVLLAISKAVSCAPWQVSAACALLREGSTIPFVSRYRAHVTGGLLPAQLRAIEEAQREAADVAKRRDAIEKSLREREPPLLTDGLRAQLQAATTLRELEELYEPYKRKRDTLATRAHEAGLGDLAAALWRGGIPSDEALALRLRAARCAPDDAPTHLVHALAELIALDGDVRTAADGVFARHGLVRAEASPKAAAVDAAAFAHYAHFEGPLGRVRAHVWLALHRGAERGALKVTIALPSAAASASATAHARGGGSGGGGGGVKGEGRAVGAGDGACLLVLAAVEGATPALRRLPVGSERAALFRKAAADASARLVAKSAKARAQRLALAQARTEALAVFATNLAQLLRSPPAQLPAQSVADGRPLAVLGIDPGLANGHKCAVVCARTGALLATATVRALNSNGGGGSGGGGGQGSAEGEGRAPPPPPAESVATLRGLLRAHNVCLVGVGDGKGSDLCQRAVAQAILGTEATFTVLSEAGASAYSACPLADAELASTPVAERGAVSLARRLLDPLAELIKVPPSALGVGLYQKDLPERELLAAVRVALQDAVAEVGVDLNTASVPLLAAVPGLSARTAQAIREYIGVRGPIRSRAQLLEVKGLGPKAFENCAGFLRVSSAAAAAAGSGGGGGSEHGRAAAAQAAEPLDATRVHPESYAAARLALAAVGVSARQLAAGEPLSERAAHELRARAAASTHAPEQARALAELLCDPLLAGDPRRLIAEPPVLRTVALSISQLSAGARLSGCVRNVTPFGAFVDVGVGVDGLLHVSQLPRGQEGLLVVGARVAVRVLEVSVERARIGLGLDDGGGKGNGDVGPREPNGGRGRGERTPGARPSEARGAPTLETALGAPGSRKRARADERQPRAEPAAAARARLDAGARGGARGSPGRGRGQNGEQPGGNEDRPIDLR